MSLRRGRVRRAVTAGKSVFSPQPHRRRGSQMAISTEWVARNLGGRRFQVRHPPDSGPRISPTDPFPVRSKPASTDPAREGRPMAAGKSKPCARVCPGPPQAAALPPCALWPFPGFSGTVSRRTALRSRRLGQVLVTSVVSGSSSGPRPPSPPQRGAQTLSGGLSSPGAWHPGSLHGPPAHSGSEDGRAAVSWPHWGGSRSEPPCPGPPAGRRALLHQGPSLSVSPVPPGTAEPLTGTDFQAILCTADGETGLSYTEICPPGSPMPAPCLSTFSGVHPFPGDTGLFRVLYSARPWWPRELRNR